MFSTITRIANYVLAATFTLAITSVLASIVVLAANDPTVQRDYGNGPGFALIMILQG
jgi:hypothetical protein